MQDDVEPDPISETSSTVINEPQVNLEWKAPRKVVEDEKHAVGLPWSMSRSIQRGSRFVEDGVDHEILVDIKWHCRPAHHNQIKRMLTAYITQSTTVHIQLNMMDIDRDSENTMDIVYQAENDNLKGDNESLMDVDSTRISQEGDNEDLMDVDDGDNKDLMDVNDGDNEDLMDVDDGDNEDLMDVDDGDNDLMDVDDGDNKDLMDIDDYLRESYKTMIYKNSPPVDFCTIYRSAIKGGYSNTQIGDVYGPGTRIVATQAPVEKPMTPFESLLWNVWLTKVRTCRKDLGGWREVFNKELSIINNGSSGSTFVTFSLLSLWHCMQGDYDQWAMI
ncbi:hypothetical protein EV424DRAFT_1352963 [Suillus variegatus]|nr:hypothetical protein EV424DRAFT_1352963 [Suillus variegatus]